MSRTASHSGRRPPREPVRRSLLAVWRSALAGIHNRGVCVRLSEKVYSLISERAVMLELPPSAVIDEQLLTEGLDLGRTPIREASQHLDAEGLVTVVPRRGTFVSDVSITNLQKTFELRIVLESWFARLAAERITRDELDQIKLVLSDLNDVHDAIPLP